jgi:hypothetical protein
MERDKNYPMAQLNASGRFPPLSSKHSEIPLKFNHQINVSHQISKLLKHLRHNNCTYVSTMCHFLHCPLRRKLSDDDDGDHERDASSRANYNFGINTGRSPRSVLLNRNWTKSTLRGVVTEYESKISREPHGPGRKV